MLEGALEFLAEAQLDNAGHSITYYRGGLSVVIPATVGETLFESTDQQGFAISAISVDFLIEPGLLVISGSKVEPSADDVIVLQVGSRLLTHKITSFADSPTFEYTDSFRTRMCIHTKKTLEADA